MVDSGNRLALLVLIVFSSLTSFAQSAARTRIPQVIDQTQRVVVRGLARSFARPEFDAGRVDGSMLINGVSLTFNLSPDQQTALHALLLAQQDRASASYHKWLTPEQYADRFGMIRADLAKVTAWLQSEGLTVNSTSRSRTQISFSGTAAQIDSAFRTEIHHYLINGEIHFAASTALSVPDAFAGTVLSVGNLSDFRAKPRTALSSDLFSFGLSPHYTNSTSGDHYLAPADFATMYDLTPLYTAGFDGTGQTIAIMGQTAIQTSTVDDTGDLDDFRTAAGLPTRTSANFQQVLVTGTGNPAIVPSDLVEADLDLEWAEAVAPNVNLIFVYIGDTPNLDAFNALQYTIDNLLAPIISITYGACEASPLADPNHVQQWAQQANVQGQTIIAASGDSGAADCDSQTDDPATQGLAVDVPASIPEVTGVGGTEFNGDLSSTTTTAYWNAANSSTGGSAISYIPEMTWNDTAEINRLSASGGGASTLFLKPAWQVGANVPDDNQRDVPDIALNASSHHDSYLICTNGSCASGFTSTSATGGTSFGAPAFAGILALINQRTSSSQGNVNPTLYSLAQTTPTAFHDITTGTNEVPCMAGSPDCPASGMMGFSAGPGYDQTTGLGSLDASVLVNAWPAAYTIAANPTTISIAAAGEQGTSALSVTMPTNFTGTFTGTVTLACAPQANITGLTCQISPSSVTAASPNATLTVSTEGSGSASLIKPHSRFEWIAGAGATLFAGIFLFEIPFFRRRRSGLPLLLLIVFLAMGLGCGGSSPASTPPVTPPSTPPGTYTITITGTSGSTSFPMTVSVTVQ
jgi:subtilase family serine protease